MRLIFLDQIIKDGNKSSNKKNYFIKKT